jgi:hypothetical protein
MLMPICEGPVVSDVPDHLSRSRADVNGPRRGGGHATISRWIQTYAAELEKRIHPDLRMSNGS